MGEKNNIPQIRFKKFEDNWKKLELFQIVDLRSGRDYKHLTSGNIPVYGTGGYMLSVNKALSYNEDAIGIGRKGTIDKPYILKAPFWTVDTLFYAVPRNHHSLDFIHAIFQNINWKHKDESTGVPSLSKVAINNITTYSTSINEQSKIGTYFQNLDKLITLQQQKHDKLVTLKKAMLDKMFPKEGADVPEIRFKGFKDKWEKRKLKEISIKVTEKNTPIRYCETFTNSAEYGIISQRDYFDNDISNSDNIDRYYVVKNDDFVYNPRISSFAPVGPINRNRLGRNGIMSPLYTVFRTQDVDVTFLEHFFKTDCWHTFMRLNGDTGARSDRFSIKDFLFVEMPIPFPKIEEQSQIGSFFHNLDKLISLQQQEIQKLKNIKKACREKMFV